jgi:hypothetical protein
MSDDSTIAPAPLDNAVPTNEYERFLAALPESMREACRARLSGSGFSPDHPVFQVLADVYEKSKVDPKPVRDFIGEATLHADRSKQLLDDLEVLPRTILGQIEPQLLGLLSALNAPVEKLETTATHLQRNIEALPVLLLGRRHPPAPASATRWEKFKWWMGQLIAQTRLALTDHLAWVVSGTISATVAVGAAAVILVLGASHLSRSYDEAYRDRLAHLEADSVQNTVALNRLLAAGITLQVERSKEGDAYFLVLPGARKAAQPVNSPEGLAVEVWP